MKKFEDLKIGDEIFILEEGFDINPVKVTGILQNKSVDSLIEIHLHRMQYPILVNKNGTFHKPTGAKRWYFISYEDAKQGRTAAKERAVRDLFREAVRCMRQIKKMAPNDDKLREKVFNMFNMKEDGSRI